MRRPLARHAHFLVACLAIGCAQEPAEPGSDTPVVSLVLIAGETQHAAVITRAAPASGPIPPTPAPVPPSLVSLGVLDDAGTLHPLVPTGEPGRFRAQLEVLAGHRYRLEGTIDGEPVTAETTVPPRFEMTEPAGDTLRAQPAEGAFWERPYSFITEGASAFVMQLIHSAGVTAVGTLTERSGVWQVFLPSIADSSRLHLRILALDRHGSGWLVSRVPQSNIQGAFGGFGSAVPVVRPLVIE